MSAGRPQIEAVEADPSASQERFRSRLERCLARTLGRPLELVSIERVANRFATLYPTELLCIELDSGERLEIFLKQLEPDRQGHPEKRCLEREVRIYEELLGDPGLPAVGFYGSAWDGAAGRYELYLEYVEDWSLRYHEIEHWLTAAGRLAELHAHFAARAERLASCEYLQHLDEAHVREWAGRAVEAASRVSGELAGSLATLVAELDPVVELLAAQPRTLVHNDLSPKNVIADRSQSPARICVIDWEMAGVGCGLMDLASLKYGLGPAEDQKMCAAYRSVLAGTGLLPSSAAGFKRLLAACEVHKGLHRIAHSPAWETPPETVERWVEDLRRWRAAV